MWFLDNSYSPTVTMFAIATSPIKTIPNYVFLLLANLLLLPTSTHASFPNLALTGTASQSSTLNSFGASNGNNDVLSDFTHTQTNKVGEWWRVDLIDLSLINNIVVYNRQCGLHGNPCNDANFHLISARLSFAELQLLDENGNSLYTATLPSTNSTTEQMYPFNFSHVGGVNGVNGVKAVKIINKECSAFGCTNPSLNLAEVQVFGNSMAAPPVPDPTSVPSLAPSAAVSTTLYLSTNLL